jgi:hypothetical protein
MFDGFWHVAVLAGDVAQIILGAGVIGIDLQLGFEFLSGLGGLSCCKRRPPMR